MEKQIIIKNCRGECKHANTLYCGHPKSYELMEIPLNGGIHPDCPLEDYAEQQITVAPEVIARYVIRKWSSLMELEEPTHIAMRENWLDTEFKAWLKTQTE